MEQPTEDPEAFGLHVVEPLAPHTLTAVLVHGRGSTAADFASELFSSHLSDGTSLCDAFPGCRWVFPSSKSRWSATFQESMPMWFDAASLTDTSARQAPQVSAIRESVAYVGGVLDAEARLLGRPERVILGGISQGGAIALWTLLCHPLERSLCAFVGASTWLPFAADIEGLLSRSGAAPAGVLRGFVDGMAGDALGRERMGAVLPTPVFLGHGADDAYVDVGLGREAARVLGGVGFGVEWREYVGAEQEGHWLQVPGEVNDIRAFLERAVDAVEGRADTL